VLDDERGGAEFAADLQDEGPEGLGLALGDPGGGFVEAQDACVEGAPPARAAMPPTVSGVWSVAAMSCARY
jgi:hypothetical protein